MIIKIKKTVMSNDGKIKSETEEKYREETESNWLKAGYKLRRNATGRHVRSAYGKGYNVYTDKEVLPLTPREKARYKKQQHEKHHRQYEARKAAKKAAEERARREEEGRLQTAWQWLSCEKRVPVEDAPVVAKSYEDWDDPDQDSSRTWYYYAKRNTRPVTDEEYQRFKADYIAKFGGWTEIDLDHTTYDGHKWW